MGGNSLKLVKLAGCISQQYGLNVPVAKLFNFPMISLLADFLHEETQPETDPDPGGNLEQMRASLAIIESNGIH
jgi:hypothetical protein